MAYIELRKVKNLAWRIETSGGEEVNNIKYLTASNMDRSRELELITSRIEFKFHKNFIIFGLRNLNLISEIYKRKTPFSTMTIIELTEADTESFYLDGNESQISALLADSSVKLIIGSENQLRRQIDIAFTDILKSYNLKNIEIITMPYVKSMYLKELNNILDVIFQKLYTSVNSYGNDIEDILIGMDNYINNWSHIFRGMDCKFFKDAYKGKPAIIVGAGPSLDKNIDLLGNARGKALIFSVDGAMNTLMDRNIIPDVVSSIERVELTANFYKKKEIPKDIIYVGPNVVQGSILERFTRIIFTGRNGDGLFRSFNENIGFTNLNVGLNVSHVLISFARYLGCSPVIFMGLDLAYTNGKTHTEKFSDNFDEKFMDNYKRNMVSVKGQDGETLETSEHFMHTKSWIESIIASEKDGVFINATEGGANIDGACNLKLADAISSYCIGDDLIKLRTKYDKVSQEQINDKESITAKALNFFDQLTEYYENITKESQIFYDKLFGSKKTGRVELMEKQRLLMDEAINKSLAGKFIVQSIIVSYKRDIHAFPMDLEKEDEKRMFERNLSYYKTLVAVSKKVIESIDVYKEALKAHLEAVEVKVEG